MGKVGEKEMSLGDLHDIIGAICVEICHETNYDKKEVCDICAKVSYKLIGHLSVDKPINQSDISRSRLIRQAVSAFADVLSK